MTSVRSAPDSGHGKNQEPRGPRSDTPLLCEKAGSVKLRAAYPVGQQAIGDRGRCSRWRNFVLAAARVPALPGRYVGLAHRRETHRQSFFTAVLAYSKLFALKLQYGLGHFRLKVPLYSLGLKAPHQELAQLTE